MIATGGGLALDPNASLLPTLLVIGILFALSFFFSGTETALFSLQAIDRRQLMESGTRGGTLVGRLLGKRAATLTTILMGNEFANTALAATSAAIALRFAPDYPGLNILVLTPALVLISEITPKFLAFRTNRTWSLVASYPLSLFAFLVAPLRVVFEWIVIGIAKLFRANPDLITEGLEEAELMVLVDRGAAVGALEESEREIIGNVLELEEMPIERVMTPKPDVFSVSVDIPWDELMALCRETECSRIPVYDGGLENIVGVLLVKDLLRIKNQPTRRSAARWVYPLLLPPIFVPTSKPADAMLREFMRDKYHMAFVVDEHGTLVGLVTLDDLVDELLGEAELDTDESTVSRTQPNTFMVKAAIDLEDFHEDTGIELPEGDYHTLGGYVMHCFGRLPSQGESVETHGLRFVVREMEGRRIAEVEVSKPHEAAVG